MKSIAFFDFDGTVTTKDTMLEFIKFCKGNISFFVGILLLSPWLIAMKLKIISKQLAKEKMLTYFFSSTDIQGFNEYCSAFIKNKLPALIRPLAMEKIEYYKNNDSEVVIVSASVCNWMEGWCIANNLKCICSNLEVINNRVTGNLDGKNCNYEEKVTRILNEYNLANYQEIYCYGDTKGDKPMLKLATHAYYKYF